MFRYMVPRASNLFLATLLALMLTGAISGQQPTRPSTSQASSRVDQANVMVAEGAADLERGQVTEARTLFERALKIDPKNGAAHTYLGVLADQSGQLNEAESNFAAAVLADPASPATHNNYGAILIKLGRKKQAAAQFEISLHLNPNQPSALVNLAQIRFSEGTVDGLRAARELFERAQATAPDVEISRALVVIALRLHDSKSAASYYRSFVEQLSKAGNNAASSASRAELGAALLEAGLTPEAVEELSASLAVDPSNVNTIILLARAYLGQNQIPSAGRTLESAVARGIDSAAIYAALSDVYERSGHVENAIPAMRLAIQRDPRNEAYWFRYGMLLTDSKAPAAAVIRLQESLKSFPQSSRLWFALGIAHFAEHRTDEAAKAFARAVELDSKFAPALAYLGLTSVEEGRYGDAIAFYERSLAIDDKLAATHYLLADALLKQASPDKDRIESHLSRAVVLDPSFAPARLALGKLYFRLVRLPEAVEQFQRVVELNPNLAEAHYHLGQIYRRLKKINDSQTELATFARLSDNQKEQAQTDRKEIVRRLANVRF